MKVAGSPVPRGAEGALRACSAAAGRAMSGWRAGCAGTRGEAGATAERLDCQHRRGLWGRWSGVWAAGRCGRDRAADPAPSWGAATCARGPPLRSSRGGEGCSAARPGPASALRGSGGLGSSVDAPLLCPSTLNLGASFLIKMVMIKLT